MNAMDPRSRAERIADIMRSATGSILLADVAAQLGASEFEREFRQAFQDARLLVQGEMTIKPEFGGRYLIIRGDDAAQVAVQQARGKLRAAVRKVARSSQQAAAATALAPDERARAALERQADRAELIAAQIGFVQRQRRF